MIKKLLWGLFSLLLLILAAYFFYISDAPPLPNQTEQIVEEVLEEELPELITGQTGIADNQGVSIWYELKTPADSIKGTVLLVMGYGSTALVWPKRFWQPILDAGYQVIRYDNRGLGESSWIEDWDKENPYTLEDMAKDGIAILDHLKIEKAHVIGVSMGGMIAQRMAISHADHLLSLTSIMSTGYMLDPGLPPVPPSFEKALLKLGLKHLWNPSEENIMKFSVCIPEMLKGNGGYENDIKAIAQRTLYELRKRKGFNRKVGLQHQAAIEKSGSRLEELDQIKAPTVIIHGTDDPLVIPPHGKKYAPLIPNAEIVWIEGMGHDFPHKYVGQVMTATLKNIKKGNPKN